MIQTDASHALAVIRLSVSEFRCYPGLRLDVDPRPVVLIGPNGAGKTNILEALSFLAPGRGLRRCRLGDVARIGSEQPAWAVAASVKRGAETIELGTGRDGASERRLVRIEGRPAKSQAALGEWLGVLWLVPTMDRLFTDAAAGRRRFLDRLVLGLDPAHARRSSTYEHALRERGRLLREGRRDARWFDALEQTLAEKGAEIAAARHATVERLNAACGQGIGPFPAALLGLAGAVDEVMAERGEAQTRDWLRHKLAAGRQTDEATGPHRSDFLVRHRGKDLPAGQCSTGEQKAVLLSILLAQARIQTQSRGVPPLLLLDEVAAHLDETRRRALWDELDALGLQSWMTGTDFSLFADLGDRGQFFGVADGKVTPLLQ